MLGNLDCLPIGCPGTGNLHHVLAREKEQIDFGLGTIPVSFFYLCRALEAVNVAIPLLVIETLSALNMVEVLSEIKEFCSSVNPDEDDAIKHRGNVVDDTENGTPYWNEHRGETEIDNPRSITHYHISDNVMEECLLNSAMLFKYVDMTFPL